MIYKITEKIVLPNYIAVVKLVPIIHYYFY